MSLETSLNFLAKWEGGWSNDRADRGGATYCGVTQATYNAWLRQQGRTFQDVREMTEEERLSLYEEEYWDRAHCSDIPEPLCDVVFDMAVNSGSVRAIRTLQLCLGLPADGVWGPKTAQAVKELPGYRTHSLTQEYLDRRRDLYEEIVEHDPSQTKFLQGWLNRIDDLEERLRKV